jgi:hypothetical protein
MWVVRGKRMFPLLPFELASPKPGDGESEPGFGGQPWHSTPYQALPPVYVQNASLEIAWTRVVTEQKTIAGDVMVPFLTEEYEGFDINDPADWDLAARLLDRGAVELPPVPQPAYQGSRITDPGTQIPT